MENIKLPINNKKENQNNFPEQGMVASISQGLDQSLGSVLGKQKEIKIIEDDQEKIQRARKFMELMAAEDEEIRKAQESLSKIIKDEHIEIHKALEHFEPVLAENDDQEEFYENPPISNDSLEETPVQEKNKSNSIFKKLIGLFGVKR